MRQKFRLWKEIESRLWTKMTWRVDVVYAKPMEYASYTICQTLERQQSFFVVWEPKVQISRVYLLRE